MWSQLFRRKDLKSVNVEVEVTETPHQLVKSLNLFDLVCFGIAAIVGAGIFSTIGEAAANGGPAVVFLFILTAVACLFSALCYAEFAARVPVSGSAYTYAYVAFGELVAWIIGWALLMEYSIGNSVVAFSWSEYLTTLLAGFRINLPDWIETDYFSCALAVSDHAVASQKLDLDGLLAAVKEVQEKAAAGMDSESLNASAVIQAAKDLQVDPDHLYRQVSLISIWNAAPNLGGFRLIFDLPAMFINVLVTALVYVGIKESKTASNMMVMLKICVVIAVILVGAFYVQPTNWVPFAPNGFAGVLQGVAAVFFAFIGFDAISTTAEECRNPQRDLPRATVLTLIVCTILYIAVALVLTGMVSYRELKVSDPLAFVFTKYNVQWMAGPVALSAIVAITSVFLVFQIGQPRIWMAMARDGLLPKRFSKVHPKFKTPSFATVITGIVVGVPILFLNQAIVTNLCSIGTLFAFMLVSAGILSMERTSIHEGPKTFRVPYINGSWYILAAEIAYTIGLFTGLPENHNIFINFEAAKMPYLAFYLTFSVFSVTTIVYRLSLIPVLGVLSNLYLIAGLGYYNWLGFLLWLAIGLVIYFSYGYWKSRLRTA
jgi:basic amino acid/polyamine antiporter, APA family